MTDDRQRWRDFICSPDHPGRHLSSIGSSVLAATGDPIDLAGLEAFLSKLEGGDDDIRHLATYVDLLSGEYGRFVDFELPRLLDVLAAESRFEERIVGPALVGNPRWDRTLIGRVAGVLRPGQYVSRTARRSHDLQENRLLRWLVADLQGSVRDIRRRNRNVRLHETLERIAVQTGVAERHHVFGSLDIPVALDRGMLQAARLRRRPEYTKAAELASRRQTLLDRSPDARWHAILMLLAVGWLEPVDIDDLFELYCLVMILDVIGDELGFGEPDEFGLILPGRKHVAAFSRSAGDVKVFFDQSLFTVLGLRGRYRAVVDRHNGVSGAERRPDIIVTFERPGHARRTLLVEMKKTRDGVYLSDSIYKVFGYLYDFGSVWPVAFDRSKALLLVPDGVSPIGDTPEVVVAAAADRQVIASTLKSALLS